MASIARLRKVRADIRKAGGVRGWVFYLPGPGPWFMSWVRKRWVIFRNPRARIEFNGPVYLGPRFSLHMPDGGAFIVGPGVEFRRGFRAEVGPEGRITIGGGSVFTYDVLMQCSTSIDIGDRVTFAQCTMVVDGNHRFRDLDRPMLSQGYNYRPLRLEDDVTIMSKATIIASIGTRSLIGANSVVTRDIPPYCFAAGVPATLIDYFGPPGHEPPGLAERSASSAEPTG